MEPEMTTPPLVSVVIATRNRMPYAIASIHSILESTDTRLQLVVQDNSDSRDLESYLRVHVPDSRLRYRYTPPPFSATDNFNAAVELATGEYVCLIGDDDGINPELLEAAAWARTADLDALAPKNIANYVWPDAGISPAPFRTLKAGDLTIAKFSGTILEVDVRQEVRRLLHNGGVYYQSFHLPKLYHGLVRRRCLESIRSRVGVYFQGLSPDIFAVLALSEVVARVAVIDYPLTIPGVCGASASADALKGRHTGRLQDAPHFRDRGEYHWSEVVPYVYSPETIWVDSAVAGLRAMGREDLVQELNLPKLAAYCIGANRGITVPTVKGMFQGLRRMGRNTIAGALVFGWSLFTGPGVKCFERVRNWARLATGTADTWRKPGLETIGDASQALSCYLRENGRSLSACVGRQGR